MLTRLCSCIMGTALIKATFDSNCDLNYQLDFLVKNDSLSVKENLQSLTLRSHPQLEFSRKMEVG